nr:hypothetical protein [Tanacetum cinerariifolium]
MFSDDQSCSDEDVLEKTISKPLSEEEIIPMESLQEFAGELTLLKSIPPGINETDCDFEEDIRLIEKLLYDNSSPRPLEEFVYDYESERDILILKDLPSNNTLSFSEKESFHFDIPLFSRPPAKPPDGDTGILNIKMMGDIYDQKAFMHKLMITLAPRQEKSPDLLSHRCGTLKKFNTHRSHLNECPILIHGQNNPPLGVLLFHFILLDSLKYGGIWSSSFDLKQALRGRHPMLIFLAFFFLFSIPGSMKTLTNGFCTQVFIISSV